MKLLVTGYPGWLTTRFLETLGDYPAYAGKITSIRCLTLGQAPLPSVPVHCENVAGNLNDCGSLKAAAAGMDLVLHAAGILHVKRNRDFYRVNRDGTENLLKACMEAGIRKFLYVSSNAAQGFCEGPGHALDESAPCRPESHYGKSKYEAELAVQKYHCKGTFETVTVRPAMFYGPPVPERHLGIYRRIARGSFPVFGTGDYLRSVTYIDNLVQGIHLALHRECAGGQTYYIADRVIPTLNDILRTIAECMDVRLRIVHYPAWMAAAAGMLDAGIAALGGYWMLPHLVGESCKNIACRIEKAEAELGYDPKVSFRDGYIRTIAWCRDRHLI